MKTIITYLLLINFTTFLLFFIDKRKAVKKKWRIRESVLLVFSALGGSLGGFVAMELFRHKTKTPIFKFGMPIIIILQIAIAIYITKSV